MCCFLLLLLLLLLIFLLLVVNVVSVVILGSGSNIGGVHNGIFYYNFIFLFGFRNIDLLLFFFIIHRELILK
jgi:hypothetical protein